MRFYDLIVSDPTTGAVWYPTSTGKLVKGAPPPQTGSVSTDSSGMSVVTVAGSNGVRATSTFTSWVKALNGQMVSDPGALNIEFDFATIPFNTPQGSAQITVHGVGLQMIGQAANLNGQNITLQAGMKPGLPLATAAASQAGTILEGSIFQAFGNWQGTDQTLCLVCYPSASQQDQTIQFYWPANMPLSTALANTFSQAFPKYNQQITISNISRPADGHGYYFNLQQLSDYIQQISRKIGVSIYGAQYPGVSISVTGNTIIAYDSVNPLKTIQIAFQDTIGQPTWISSTDITFKTVLRADISVGMIIKLPTGISGYALNSAASAQPNTPASSKSAFQGSFFVNEVHHWANFRQPDADSWNTTFTAAFIPPMTG